MNIVVDKTTITQFELVRLCHQPTAAGLVTMADLRLRNAAGAIIARHSIPVTWTTQELAVLEAKVAERETEFAAATGWTKYVPPTKEN
ncbi:MAG TPA: hypothetical protein VM223_10190 [Planctomycetota bacterium]|nr:hypothetical protein [Planctomycetota bacterium]